MKVLVAGDFCDCHRVSQKIDEKDYCALFDDVQKIIKSVDYSLVNFEFPIVINKGIPIQKCGPNLRGHKESVEAIKNAGFKCCTLANNHILDQGTECGLETKKLLEESHLDTVGFDSDRERAAKILYKEINGEILAIINCCEHEFSIATENTAGANPLNPIHQFYKIQEAKKNANFVLVIVHGGHEHYNLPSLRMQDTYRFFIDAGADAVANHHQHCYSGYELYNGKPIFYGLGNFLFDNPNFRNSFWNEGFLLKLDLASEINFSLFPYTQSNESPTVRLMNKESSKDFFLKIQGLNAIISDRNRLQIETDKYYKQSVKHEIANLEPYNNKVLSKLYCLGLLPSFINKKKLASILNHVDCEAHRDKLLYALTKNIK